MENRRPLSVLHCPCDVGGQSGTLAKFERALGLDSWSVALTAPGLGMPIDEVIADKGDNRFLLEIGRWSLLARAALNYDVLHFNFGRSIAPLDHRAADRYAGASAMKRWAVGRYAQLTWFKDVALLKRLGKTIVMTYQGDDARQGDYCRKMFRYSPAMEVNSGYYTAISDASKRKAIDTIGRLADRIYALNPDLLAVLPPGTEFLPYANLDFLEWPMIGPAGNDVPLVLHAPTSREFKGTKYILDAVAKLKQEGVKFQFQLIEDMTRDQAHAHYERADLLIDQVLAGWYGGLAVELMALGKPVICYLRYEDLHCLPPAMQAQLPILNANPDSLANVLRRALAMSPADRASLGQDCRRYVERWHDPMKIAARLKNDYQELHSLPRRTP